MGVPDRLLVQEPEKAPDADRLDREELELVACGRRVVCQSDVLHESSHRVCSHVSALVV